MGKTLCFYSVDTRTKDAKVVCNDTAPKEGWNLDVLTVEGENRFLAVVEEIKQASEALESLP